MRSDTLSVFICGVFHVFLGGGGRSIAQALWMFLDDVPKPLWMQSQRDSSTNHVFFEKLDAPEAARPEEGRRHIGGWGEARSKIEPQKALKTRQWQHDQPVFEKN